MKLPPQLFPGSILHPPVNGVDAPGLRYPSRVTQHIDYGDVLLSNITILMFAVLIILNC